MLAKNGLKEFHGRTAEFPSQEAAYREFVGLLKAGLEAEGGYATFQLCHKDAYSTIFSEFAPRVVGGITSALGHPGSPGIDWLKSRCQPTLWMAVQFKDLPGSHSSSIQLEVDPSDPADTTAVNEQVFLTGTMGALAMSRGDALARIGTSYGAQLHSSGTVIKSVAYPDSLASILIQAADLIANFGVASMKKHLRCSGDTLTETTKSRLFDALLPDAPPSWYWPNLRSSLTVNHKNELAGGAGAVLPRLRISA
ncbi:MAG: hypothetical protein EYC70_07000 [Planctomycetota bacterium]|nr:MAG: hypothetical protein EYC70_07000 [Planctomycetota bacterium]